jgi:hypothetical protein
LILGQFSTNKKFIIFLSVIYVLYALTLLLSGYFRIGLLSDDYLNFYDAVNSSLAQKFTSNLPYTNYLHFRPLYYLSLQFSALVHDFLGFSYDDFVLYRLQNLVIFLLISFVAGKIILLKTGNLYLSLFASFAIIIFPNNIHNICWTAARVDLLCCLFYILTIFFSFLYFERSRNLFLVLSIVCFLFALLTKETSATAPIAVLLFALYNFNSSALRKHRIIFILLFSVIICYVIFKVFFLRNDLTQAITLFHDNPLGNVPGVIARSIISLFIPVDYLTLNLNLRNRETIFLIYLLFLYALMIYTVIIIIRSAAYQQLFHIIVLGIIMILPYIYIGYIRPQMILIPFVFLIIQGILFYQRSDKIKKNLNQRFARLLIAGCLIFWLNWSVSVVQDWKFAYENSKQRLESFLDVELDHVKAAVIIGNPLRYKQAFMFNRLTGAYNFWKYKNFNVNQKFNDIVQTAALDPASINSTLSVITTGPDEFDIAVTGSTQFFTMEGFDNVRIRSGFQNKDMSVEFMDFNILDKPRKIKLKIFSRDIPFYIVNGMNYSKLN